MDEPIDPEALITWLIKRYGGVHRVEVWGESSMFYNPGHLLPRGAYFATVKQRDGKNDHASQLDRPGVYRFNVGTSRPLYFERFGPQPVRPGKGGVIDGDWDFSALNVLMPHPVYGWGSWVAVICPSQNTLSEMEPLIDAGYAKAKATFEKKLRST